MSEWEKVPGVVGKYNLLKTIGKGSFSLVKMCVNTDTRQNYAAKIIPKINMKSEADKTRFEGEIKVIITMNHPGVIKVMDFLADSNFYFLIMEFCSGGTLLSQAPGGDRVIREDDTKIIFKQLLESIDYMHKKSIAHRDLKLENVMLDEKGNIKIVDFGFSRFAESGTLCVTPCGTPAYAAPEVLSGIQYDGPLADMWSLGVCLYVLLTGNLPWKSGNQVVLYNQIRNAAYEIPSNLSRYASDLISRLLCLNPLQRLTASQAISHPWLEGVEVTWDSKQSLHPTMSFKSFEKILKNEPPPPISPRSALESMTQRKSVTRLSATAITRGTLSFGQKVPVTFNAPKIDGSGFGGTVKFHNTMPIRLPNSIDENVEPQ